MTERDKSQSKSPSTELLENSESKILLAAAMELSSTLDLEDVMQKATDHITKLTGIGTAAIYLVRDKELYLGAATPPIPSELPDEFRLAYLENHNHIKKAVTQNKIISIPDTKTAKLTPEEKLVVEQRNLRSLWYIPISTPTDTIGVFIIASQGEVRTCSPKELELSNALSNIVALALQNSILHKKLAKKNEELRTTLLSIGDAVISTDIEGNVVLMNHVAENLCGYSNKEAYGKPLKKVFKIVNSKTREILEDPVSKVIDEGQRVHLANHTILISTTGKEFQISDSAAPILDKNGEITGVVLVFSDVTEEYGLREDLKKSKENLDKAELMGGFGNWELDLNNKTITGSTGAANIYGLEKETFILEEVQKIPLLEYRKTLDEALDKLIKENKPYSVEFKIKKPDGKIRFVHSEAKFEARSNKVFGVLNDITDSKLAEEALLASEKSYREFFMKDLTGDFLSTVDGKVVDCNPAFLSILGYSSLDEIQRLSVTTFYFNENERKILLERLVKEKEITFHEMKMKKSDGKTITVIENVVGIFDENGRLTHMRGYLFDITDRKIAEENILQAKEKAEAADRMKTEFLAQMSHEIRSPLNAMLSFTDLVREMTSDSQDEDLKTCFSGINSASKRIITTIDSILNMSDLQMGTYQIANRSINAVSLFESLVGEYKSIARDKNIELKFKPDINEKVVFTDEYALSQIAANLIDNAIKYTKKGFVEIQIMSGDQFGFKIIDSGIGISEDYLPNLFNPFTQEEQGYSRSFDGNGLGLALVKKYCGILNADISVESKKDVGTTFTVKFAK